jgi:chromosome partitioning protein
MWHAAPMAHRVLTVCGLKGGIAKTSTAVNLAAWWSAAGRRVLIVDADPNGSATKLHQRGDGQLLQQGSRCVPLQGAPMAMASPWDLVIVDTAGGSRDEQRTYAEGSDLVICPCQPAASSIEQVMDLAEIITATGRSFAVLLTMVDERRRVDAVRARELFQQLQIPVMASQITMLSAWPKSEAAGVAVRDARADSGRLDPGGSRAWQQVGELAAEIDRMMG